MPSLQEEIAEIEAKNLDLKQKMAELAAQIHGYAAHVSVQKEALPAYFAARRKKNTEQLKEAVAGQPLATHAAWNETAWSGWQAELKSAATVRFGTLHTQRADSDVELPAFLPLIGDTRTIAVMSQPGQVPEARTVMQNLILRLEYALPHQINWVLLDPVNAGAAFPMRRSLANVMQGTGDLRKDLDEVNEHIKRIIRDYFDAEVNVFEQIPLEMRANERYHVVVASDFPNGYSRAACEALIEIARNGPKAGVRLVLHVDPSQALPRDLSMAQFEPSFKISTNPVNLMVGGVPLVMQADTGTVPSALQQQLAKIIADKKPNNQVIPWSSVVGMNPADWWSGDAATNVLTPIGKQGRGSDLNVVFGDFDGRPVVHGALAGMTGSGKSSFYHSLILGLTIRYSPSELRLYLIDGKYGVEFQPYALLPHAEVVSLNTMPQLARSVLNDIVSEMSRRNTLFSRYGVTDFAGYRRAGQPGGAMPRILLIVDEYQYLFEDDDAGLGSSLVSSIASLGRSAGINMLLASQQFRPAKMRNSETIFNNLHMRIAMKMPEATARSLTEFGPRGRRIVTATCTAPGRIVVNDEAGEDTDQANRSGKVAFISREEIATVLRQVSQKGTSLGERQVGRRILIEGRAQPELSDNAQFKRLQSMQSWPNSGELQQFARSPILEDGLELSNWFESQVPAVAWVGQNFSVRGQATLVFERGPAQNALVVGGFSNPARYGMLSSVLVSLALNAGPQRQRFVVIDRSTVGAQWAGSLQQTVERVLLPAGFDTRFTRDQRAAEQVITELLEEFERRRALDEADRLGEMSIFLLMSELDGVESLRKLPGNFGPVDSKLGERLRRLFTEGPSLGMHSVISASGQSGLEKVLGIPRDLAYFRHRVALQMPESESYTLVGSSKAAKLQVDKEPVVAWMFDAENPQSAYAFKPYSTAGGVDGTTDRHYAELERIGGALANRRQSAR